MKEFEEKLEIIRTISGNRLCAPHHIPVEAFIQEANDLYHWSQTDKEALIGGGLNWELVKDLPSRIETLVEAQARWVSAKKTGGDAQAAFAEQVSQANRLRDRLRRDFRHAFDERPALLAKLKHKSRDHAGLIQDLNDLSVLGRDNPEILEAIQFDTALLDQAARTAKELAALLARVTAEGKADKEAKIIRDQAYTYLKEAVDVIRRCGQYVFRLDKRRFQGYASQHLRKLRKK